MSFLSVILPTLNCAETIPAHIQSMEPWLDLVDEIIAVDSYSEDGTPDIICETIRHPNLRILNHPRGLYQSWNHAISESTGKWIYISTIGDSITRDQLQHLLDSGEALRADVVVSQPEFVFDDKINMTPPVWPISHILQFYQIKEPTIIDPVAAFCHASQHLPNAIIGSSASNLYRGDHLRSRPFPTTFSRVGDTAWALRYAMETRFCYTFRIGSVFRFHSDTYLKKDLEGYVRLINLLQTECRQLLETCLMSNKAKILILLKKYIYYNIEYQEARTKFKNTRRESIVPWFFRSSTVKAHGSYKRLKRDTEEAKSQLNEALRQM
jgi:glycosyltransferase involved in cell wall biosynthesis